MAKLYKIIDAEIWLAAERAGVFNGAAIDLRDGYIHLSTASQEKDTARLHFSGVEHLVLVAIDEPSIATALKWEASRGGQLFPHVYDTLDPAKVLWVKPLLWTGETHEFPELDA